MRKPMKDQEEYNRQKRPSEVQSMALYSVSTGQSVLYGKRMLTGKKQQSLVSKSKHFHMNYTMLPLPN
jgi:hypothetical protein